MSEIVLGVRLQPSQFQRIKLENIALTNNVESLKAEAAQKINVESDNIELVYRGLILKDGASLESCDIKPGVMVHVYKKKKRPTPEVARKPTKSDLQNLASAFRRFTYTPGYRAALQRLSRAEVLNNIIASTPGLADDPIAISILRDPELLVQMSDPDTVKKTSELHPSLIEAAQQIAAHVYEEALNVTTNAPSTSTGYSYSLDALSDSDEEMDTAAAAPQEGQPLQRNSSYNAITAAQLAAAIANATNSPAANSSSPGVITSEMFSSAMQQAFTSNPATPTRLEGAGAFETPVRNRFQTQLQQMEEMGLRNVAINTRALQATAGDVQAAVELVLSGAFD